jgi:hypothetical protein
MCCNRLVVDQSITLRRVVPILGVPDALVPIDPSSPQINLLPGYCLCALDSHDWKHSDIHFHFIHNC